MLLVCFDFNACNKESSFSSIFLFVHKALKKVFLFVIRLMEAERVCYRKNCIQSFRFFFCNFNQAVQHYFFSFNYNFPRVSSVFYLPLRFSIFPSVLHWSNLFYNCTFFPHLPLAFLFFSIPIFRLSHFLLLSTPLFHFPFSTLHLF